MTKLLLNIGESPPDAAAAAGENCLLAALFFMLWLQARIKSWLSIVRKACLVCALFPKHFLVCLHSTYQPKTTHCTLSNWRPKML
jgi:hypothetical protein